MKTSAAFVLVLLRSLVGASGIDGAGDDDGPHHHHHHHHVHKTRQIGVRTTNMTQAKNHERPLQLLPTTTKTNQSSHEVHDEQMQFVAHSATDTSHQPEAERIKHLEVTLPSAADQTSQLPTHEVPEAGGLVVKDQEAQQMKHLEVSLPSQDDTEVTPPQSIKRLEWTLPPKDGNAGTVGMGKILVKGPLPADFPERFAHGVGEATGADPSGVRIVATIPQEGPHGLEAATFEAPADVVDAVEHQATDPTSKLIQGPLRPFLVFDGPPQMQSLEPTPLEESLDIDTAMPYGDMEPFGREDTAQELTESSVKESDAMVDQLERAEVAEEKRAVFRALTRLRGAAITSFDGVARSQTGNIDEYNKVHKWRNAHPLHHLADEESDIAKWAFPDNADFIQTKI